MGVRSRRMKIRSFGFTLIEMLVVMAIISTLAAIIFPVYVRSKDSANRSSDITSMNQLRTALQLYKADQGDFPPSLLGYVTVYSSGPNLGQVIPADQLFGALYPKRLESINAFRPINDKQPYASATGLSGTAAAAWPNQDPRSLGDAPAVDINGDGILSAADDSSACARQAFGPQDQVMRVNPADPLGPQIPARYYRVSGYEIAPDRTLNGAGNFLGIRYTRFWTGFGLGTGGACGAGGSAQDDPRQLGYREPPDSTVITWNSWFRDSFLPDGTPARERRDVVLFLGGGARTYDSRQLWERSWRVNP